MHWWHTGDYWNIIDWLYAKLLNLLYHNFRATVWLEKQVVFQKIPLLILLQWNEMLILKKTKKGKEREKERHHTCWLRDAILWYTTKTLFPFTKWKHFIYI